MWYPFTAGQTQLIGSAIAIGTITQASMTFYMKMNMPINGDHYIVDDINDVYFVFVGAFSPNVVKVELCSYLFEAS